MTVASVTNGFSAVAGAPERDYSTIGKLDFMTLLVAQIKNQDPMSPMDNSQFTSQITEFTMLEEMEGLNAKMEENLLVGQSINNTAMLSLVGKNVTVEGDKTTIDSGEATKNSVVTEAPGVATITVKDSSGKVVATYEKNVSQGINDISWDGIQENGEGAGDGLYSIEVSVENGEATIPFTTLMTGAVEGLRYDNNVAVVSVGGQEYYVSEIYQVS